MKYRGEIDSQVDLLKQSVKDICAEMHSIKHFDPVSPEALLNLYLRKPSQTWVKELETSILACSGVARPETLIFIQEILQTTSNQVNFIRNIRLERAGLRTALQAVLDDRINYKMLQTTNYTEECSSALSVLIEAPLSDENLVREFVVFDTLRQIAEFYGTADLTSSSSYEKLKKSLENNISQWKAEDILAADQLGIKVLKKFLCFSPQQLEHRLGKRVPLASSQDSECWRSQVEVSEGEPTASKQHHYSSKKKPSDKQRVQLCKGRNSEQLGVLGDGSFLTTNTFELAQENQNLPVVKESKGQKRIKGGFSLFNRDFADPKTLSTPILGSGPNTGEVSGGYPITILGQKTSTNTSPHTIKCRESQESEKSKISSKDQSHFGQFALNKTVLMQQSEKPKIQPARCGNVSPPALATKSRRKVQKFDLNDSSASSPEVISMFEDTPDKNLKECISRQLTNLNYSDMKEKLDTQYDLQSQQRYLQKLMLQSFDSSREQARKILYDALATEYDEISAKFQAKKLEIEIFGLFYNDINTYQEKVKACAINLRKMLAKDWPADHLMTTCLDYDLLASIQGHITSMVKGSAQPAIEELSTEYRGGLRQAQAAGSFSGAHLTVDCVSPKPAHANFQMLQEDLHHFSGQQLQSKPQGISDSSRVEPALNAIERVTPWKHKNSTLPEHLRNTAETERRPPNRTAMGPIHNAQLGFQDLGNDDLWPFDDEDLDLSTDSFEFLEYIAKIREVEVEMLKQHAESLKMENELLREALLHVKTNLMVLQTIDCEQDSVAGGEVVSRPDLQAQSLANAINDRLGGLNSKCGNVESSPKGAP